MRLAFAALLVLLPGPSAADAALSAAETAVVREVGELAGWNRFCGFAWRPLHDALMAAARRAGGNEIEAIEALFLAAGQQATDGLDGYFCAEAQVRLDLANERLLERLEKGPPVFQ